MTLPHLVFLHFLGGSARTWSSVTEKLAGQFIPLGIDLPGFGTAAEVPGHTVAAMADHAAAAIRAAAPDRFVLAGHSMGAKVAAVLARRAEDGDPALAGLSGLALLGGSPPSPEPMDDAKRTEMLGWFRDGDAASHRQARHFIKANLGRRSLYGATMDALVADVLAARRDAWCAWLEHGSREDWSDRIGRLALPALVLSGSEDADLGEDAQHRLVLPHLADAEAATLRGAGHLLPQERPDAVARLIASRFAAPATVPADYRALIDSPRVSTGTRTVLLDRLHPAPPGTALSPAERATLRAVVDRVVPQAGPHRIDLADRLHAGLAGPGDGWRAATLPPDRTAWPAGLRTLDALAEGFAGAEPEAQDRLLHQVEAGNAGGELDAAGMQAWFEDLRSEAVRHYVAHPATFARLGYAGIAYGGDGPYKPGFTALGMNQREAWEPA